LIILISITAVGLEYRAYLTNIELQKSQIRDEMSDVIFEHKKIELENIFRQMYETARTISLLPSVRHIEGGNRQSAEEDVVALGRFSEDADVSVQQLYNNIVNNIALSEIYAVVDGLNSAKGEVPFFMYDSLILEKDKTADDEEEATSSDFPEELETEEYSYYPKQIEQLKSQYPTFNFNKLDDIPAVFSPVMRTCDNTQYTSKSTGNEKDAYGFLYSVPFYGDDDRLKGIISMILRTNVLEARLLDLAYLPVTPEEVQLAQSEGVSVSESYGNFILQNSTYEIAIFDRRNTTLLQKIQTGLEKKDPNILSKTLKINGDSDWILSYSIEPIFYEKVVSSERWLFLMNIGITLLISAVGIAVFIFAFYRKLGQYKQEAAHLEERAKVVSDFTKAIRAVAEGDLKVSLNDSRGSDMQDLISQFDGMKESLNHVMDQVKSESSVLLHKSSDSEVSMNTLMKQTIQLNDNMGGILDSVVNISNAAEFMERQSIEIALAAKETLSTAHDGSRSVDETLRNLSGIRELTSKGVDAVSDLNEKSQQIGDVIGVIKGISNQTNLLALNASIEASRAGEAGRGFEVVANEIRVLSVRTEEATMTIKKLIEDIQQSVALTLYEMGETHSYVLNSMDVAREAQDKLNQITVASKELAESISLISSQIKQQAFETVEIKHQEESMEKIASMTKKQLAENVQVIHELILMADHLMTLVNKFK